MNRVTPNPAALVSTQWVADHLNDPNVRLIEVDVDTAAYGQGHVAGRCRRQLDHPAGRSGPARYSDQGRLGQAAQRIRRRPGHAHHLLWRQQQLVRRLRLLGQQDLRPPERRADERRPQEVGAREPPADHRRGRASPPPRYPAHEADLTYRAFLQDVLERSSGTAPSSTCARLPSSPARSSPRQASARPPSAAATSPARANIPWAQAAKEDGTFKSRRRAQDAVWRQRRHGRQRRHRLLPHRRAVVLHLVRAQGPARLQQRQEL